MADTQTKRKVKIACPACQQRLDVTGLDPNTTVGCPTCGMKMIVPAPEPEHAKPAPKYKIICSQCDQRLDVTALDPSTSVRCPSCGMKLIVPPHDPEKPVARVQAQPFVAVVRSRGPAAAPAPARSRGVAGKLLALAACAACAWGLWHYRENIFGSPEKQIAAPTPAAPAGPTGVDVWQQADTKLAAGRFEEALDDYRLAAAKLLDEPPRHTAVLSQVGATLYLLGKAADAHQTFEDAVPSEARHGFGGKIDNENFVVAVDQVVLGVVKPEAAERRFKDEMPAAWTLAQFYLGAQALGEGRFADAARWLGDYAKARTQDQAKWVLFFQDRARLMTGELASLANTLNEIARAQADEKTTEAAAELRALQADVQQNPRRAFLRSHLDAIQREITRLAAVWSEDPAIKKQKALALEKKELERLAKYREQFAADATLFPPAEQAAVAAIAGYDFAAAASIYTSTAGHITATELKKVAEDRAALYQRLVALKQQAIEAMPASPYAKPGLMNRRGGAIAGKATKADAQTITFTQEHGEVAVPWRDLDPLSLLTLLTSYGDLAAASRPAERAANFIALAWLSRDLKRNREMIAYANYSAQLAPDTKAEWDRLTGPLPQPPALPGQVQPAEDPALSIARIPPFMQAGGMAQALSHTNLPSLLDIIPKPATKPKK